jgi:hypothetical protein
MPMTDQQKAARLQRIIAASKAATASIERTIAALKVLKKDPTQFDAWRDHALADIAEELAQLREKDCVFWRAIREAAMSHARHHRTQGHLFEMQDSLFDARRANRCLISEARVRRVGVRQAVAS